MSENNVGKQIPAAFDGDEKRQQPMENVLQPVITQNVPIDTQSSPTAEVDDEQRPQCARRRPSWMLDYEVTEIDDSDEDLMILMNLLHILHCFQIVIPQLLKPLSKNTSGKRLWMKKLQPSKGTTHGS